MVVVMRRQHARGVRFWDSRFMISFLLVLAILSLYCWSSSAGQWNRTQLTIAIQFENDGDPSNIVAISAGKQLPISHEILLLYRRGFPLKNEHRTAGFHSNPSVRVVEVEDRVPLVQLIAAEARSDIIVMLHPLIVVDVAWILEAYGTLETKAAGIVGCAVPRGGILAVGFHMSGDAVNLVEGHDVSVERHRVVAPLPLCVAAHRQTFTDAGALLRSVLVRDDSRNALESLVQHFGLQSVVSTFVNYSNGADCYDYDVTVLRVVAQSLLMRLAARLEIQDISNEKGKALMRESVPHMVAPPQPLTQQQWDSVEAAAERIVSSRRKSIMPALETILTALQPSGSAPKPVVAAGATGFAFVAAMKNGATASIHIPTTLAIPSWATRPCLLQESFVSVGFEHFAVNFSQLPSQIFIANHMALRSAVPLPFWKAHTPTDGECRESLLRVGLNSLLNTDARLCAVVQTFLHGGIACDWRLTLSISGAALLHKQRFHHSDGFVVGTSDPTVFPDGALFIGGPARSPALLALVYWMSNQTNSSSLTWLQILNQSRLVVKHHPQLSIAIPSRHVALWPLTSRDDSPRGRIPHRLILSVPAVLSPAVRDRLTQWHAVDSTPFEMLLLNDTACEGLAAQRGSRALWRALQVGAVRSEYCRMAAVFYFGGVYVDLDVEPYRPLGDVLRSSGPLLLVASQGPSAPSIASWMFAAVVRHTCIAQVLKAYEQQGPSGAAGGSFLLSKVIARQCDRSELSFLDVSGPIPLHREGILHTWNGYDSAGHRSARKQLLQSWRRRLMYTGQTMAPSRTASRSYETFSLEGLPQVQISDDECRAALKVHTDEKESVWQRWHQVPWFYRSALCGLSVAASLQGNSLIFDARTTVAHHLSTLLASAGTPSLLLFDGPNDESPPWGLGVDSECAAAASKSLWTTVADSIYLPAPSTEEITLGVNLASASVVQDTLTRTAACARSVHRIPYDRAEKHLHPYGPSNTPIPRRRIVITPYHPASYEVHQFLKYFDTTNPDITTAVHSIDDCMKDAREASVLDEGGVKALFNAMFELQRLVCSLMYISKDGGVGLIPEFTVSMTPVTLLFNDDDAVFAGVSHEGAAIYGARSGAKCVSDVLRRVVRTLLSSSGVDPSRRFHWSSQTVNATIEDLKLTCRVLSADAKVLNAAVSIWRRTTLKESTAKHSPMVIPRQAFVVWKTSELFEAAAALDTYWRAQEPTIRRRVVNDSECRDLASRFPNLLRIYDSFPLNVMRADTCRLLVVYYYGGIYMDLDVAWVRRFDDWFNWNAGLVAGNETDGTVSNLCNWFFAASARHPCLESTLELIASAAANSKAYESEHFVHFITGPSQFTSGLARCGVFPWNVQLSIKDVNKDVIFHQYGSQRWANDPKYSSWTVERQNHLTRK